MTTIIIGLGNPGKKFEKTRHNVGFMVLDKFAEKNNFSEFELQKKCEALVSEQPFDSAQAFGSETQARGGDEKIILVKPQTFMNNSGEAAKKIIKNYKIDKFNENCKLKIENCIVVVHDDVDLPLGKIKIVKERGSAGHKGVESIIKAAGNDGLIRLRVGVKPASAKASAGKAKKIVLKKFSQDEQKILTETINKSVEALNSLIKQGLEKTMNEYN